jgi:hypothetical protein
MFRSVGTAKAGHANNKEGCSMTHRESDQLIVLIGRESRPQASTMPRELSEQWEGADALCISAIS